MNPTTTDSGAQSQTLARIAAALERAAANLVADAEASPRVVFEAPRNLDFGDFSSNVALQLARRARRSPQVLASELVERIFADEPDLREILSEATAVGGFINVRLANGAWQSVVGSVLREGPEYGRGRPTGERISLEFGSANPTGPLVVVQGRTLSLGDALAKAFRFAGHDVTTEWIINDAGSQIETLGRSLYARYRQLTDPAFPFPEDGYPGEYLIPLAQNIRERDGARWESAPEIEWLPSFGTFGLDAIVAEQQATCARFGISLDRWQSERALHQSGAIEKGIEFLRGHGHIFEGEGAVWVRATHFGDDKDRVIVRNDGRPTYFGADVAYHYDKLSRAARAILILGPDHHGYIARLELIAAALDRPGAIRVLIAQQMTLVREGEIVPMSKRAGNVLTLDEILDEVGPDAARFFFVIPNPDSPMTFDLTLAKEQSTENPVFYVQYGHARIASIERRASPSLLERACAGERLELLSEPSEIALARRLSEFPATVLSVVDALAPSRLARYAQNVAADFHQFYMNCKVLGEDDELTVARLGLAHATKIVLASSLRLLGVSAPEEMAREA
ncbi:MAG: arginine--tRNA ligase [Candidatus Eremiobacteraeota bacterium]|nr:arginine--tRNA ligase [Candidatus Eremiobacteraeota bacterium]